MNVPDLTRCPKDEEALLRTATTEFARMLFLYRMRSPADRAQVAAIFARVFGTPIPDPARPLVAITPSAAHIGWARLPRQGSLGLEEGG